MVADLRGKFFQFGGLDHGDKAGCEISTRPIWVSPASSIFRNFPPANFFRMKQNRLPVAVLACAVKIDFLLRGHFVKVFAVVRNGKFHVALCLSGKKRTRGNFAWRSATGKPARRPRLRRRDTRPPWRSDSRDRQFSNRRSANSTLEKSASSSTSVADFNFHRADDVGRFGNTRFIFGADAIKPFSRAERFHPRTADDIGSRPRQHWLQ